MINRGHNPPMGPYFLKGPPSPNLPFIKYVLDLSLLRIFCVWQLRVFGPRGSNPLNYHGGPSIHQLKQLEIPLP